MTMRDVLARSRVVARKQRNRDYELSLNSLSELEARGRVPHIYRMASLAAIYGRRMNALLGLYGAEVARRRRRRK